MDKRSLAALLVAATMWESAYGITGTTVVYDDADENGFNHDDAACGSSSYVFPQNGVVHGGTMAYAVSRNENNAVGWADGTTYSATSDYDGVVFWINAGAADADHMSFGVYDSALNPHFLHLEDIHGGPLPAGTWIKFAIPFSSPYFASNGYTAPTDFYQFCIANHSSGSMTTYFYIDDVSLSGADIFKNGFEIQPP